MKRKAKIAILRWEEGKVPEGLMQLETLPGNSTNPASYPFPVRLVPVPGACVETIITHPSQEVLNRMIGISKKLVVEEGILAISTSCGFNAVFQRQLADALDVPVFTSSLLQVPFVGQMIGDGKKVGVITANKGALTKEHLKFCGITEAHKVEIFGLENAREFRKIFDCPQEPFCLTAVESEIVNVAVEGVKQVPEMGAIVLECTDLPPFARKISQAVGLPVFDFVTMMGHVAMSLGEVTFY